MNYWRVEFQKKWFGKGDGHVGYAIETWWCFLGVTIIKQKPVGIRGIVTGSKQ